MEGDKESSASPAWFLNGAEGIVASYKANIKTKRCEMNSRELEMIVESKFNELGNVTSNSPRSKRIVYECNDSNFMQTKSILQHDNNKRRDKTLALLTQQLSLEDTERLLTQDKCNVTTYQGIALDKWHQEHETFKPGVSHQWGQRSRERQSEAQSETKSVSVLMNESNSHF